MNKLHHEYSVLLSVVFFLISTVSCGERENMARLDEADRLLDQYPDSALAIVNSIDTLSLRGPEERGRHSLLLTMALLKTDPSAVSDTIFKPAWKHYGPINEPSRETMLAHFARAALYNIGDSAIMAIGEYQQAIELCPDKDINVYRNISNLNIGSILAKIGCLDKAYDFIIKSDIPKTVPNDISKLLNYHIILGGCLNGLGRHSEAMQEYKEALRLARDGGNTTIERKVRTSLAFTLSMMGRYNETVNIFDSLDCMGDPMSEESLFAYSLSLLKVDRKEDAVRLTEMLMEYGSVRAKARYYYLQSEISSLEGDHARAIEMMDSSNLYQNMLKLSNKGGEVDKHLRQTAESLRADISMERDKAKQQNVWLWVILCVVFIAVVVASKYVIKYFKITARLHAINNQRRVLLIQRMERDGEDQQKNIGRLIERIGLLMEHSDKLLKENRTLSSEIAGYKNTISRIFEEETVIKELEARKIQVSIELEDIQKKMSGLRQEMKDAFYSYHGMISGICNRPPRRASEMASFEKERERLLIRYRDKDYVDALKRQIDFFSGGSLSKISKRLNLSDNLVLTAVYEICGFGYKVVALILGIDGRNAGVRRSRLKEKLLTLEGEDKKKCMEIFDKKWLAE